MVEYVHSDIGTGSYKVGSRQLLFIPDQVEKYSELFQLILKRIQGLVKAFGTQFHIPDVQLTQLWFLCGGNAAPIQGCGLPLLVPGPGLLLVDQVLYLIRKEQLEKFLDSSSAILSQVCDAFVLPQKLVEEILGPKGTLCVSTSMTSKLVQNSAFQNLGTSPASAALDTPLK